VDLMVTAASTLDGAAQPVHDALRDTTDSIVMVGAGTHREVGNPVVARAVCEVSVAAGIVAYDPDDMTVTALAGTTVAELGAALGAQGQEVSLDPRDDGATVGGVLATGVSGIRRLRHGPVRDTLLEARFVDGHGTLVKGGGPVVKNVAGYDIPRLLVGSLGTLGGLVQVTLRCRPRAATSAWHRVERADADAVLAALFRPSAVLCDGRATYVLLEGHDGDLREQAARVGLGAAGAIAPALPAGPHRGRISVPPGQVMAVGRALDGLDGTVEWLAELGVGTVHVACADAGDLARARAIAGARDGWLLREAGAPELDGFGMAMPNAALSARVKAAFDPDGRFAPGRLP
jgi:glycolate oxidase FAD binding subunit